MKMLTVLSVQKEQMVRSHACPAQPLMVVETITASTSGLIQLH